MRTLQYVITKCRKRFGKSDLDLENSIADFIKDELREICSSFDYWFLKVEPGMLVPSLFSTYPAQGTAAGTLLAGNWLDQGWLRVEAGQAYYPIYTTHMPNPMTPQGWGLGEISKLHFVKRFSNAGAFQSDLKIGTGNAFLSQGGFETNTLPPGSSMVWPHTVDGITYLRFHPTPTAPDIFAVGYQLAVPPWVQVGTAWTNLILQYYPKLVLELCAMEYATWFSETQKLMDSKRIIYGDTDYGAGRSDIPNWGLIGKMKQDTSRREFGEDHETGYWDSISEAVGRDGYDRRGFGGPYYDGPAGW